MITFLLLHGPDDATGFQIYPSLIEWLPRCQALEWRANAPDRVTAVQYRDGRETARERRPREQLECLLLDASVLVVWNGIIPPMRAQAVSVARKIGLPVAFLEQTAFADYLQCDPRGVNGYSTAAALPADAFQHITPAPDIEETAWRVPPARDADKALPSLSPETLFFPCQVIDDTQLQCHLPGYSGLEDVFRGIMEALPDGYTLLAKEHPVGYGADRQAYRRLRSRYPAARWCKSTPISRIFSAVRGVVTVNSSVGLQAMQAGLPVLAIGHDLWTKAGLVLRPKRSLAAGLRALAHEHPDQALRRQFLTWLRDHFYVRRDTESIIRRLGEIAAGEAPWIAQTDLPVA